MFFYALRYVFSCFAIILMGKRELFALLNLSSWCLMIVVWLFLVVPWVCLQFMIVVFPDHTHYFGVFEKAQRFLRLVHLIMAGSTVAPLADCWTCGQENMCLNHTHGAWLSLSNTLPSLLRTSSTPENNTTDMAEKLLIGT